MKKRTSGAGAASVRLDGFAGLDTSRPRGRIAAVESVNFRPLRNGAIRKRCGYGSVLSLPSTPRAIYSGYADGDSASYYLVGDRVLRHAASEESTYTEVGSVASTEGKGTFVRYRNLLYLFDGSELYLLTGKRAEIAEGYLPLYGKDWEPQERGEVYEPQNLLTSRVRIGYRNKLAWREMTFGRAVLSVDLVRCDGEEIALSEVTLAENRLSCTSELFAQATEIELVVRFAEESRRSEVAAASDAFLYGNADDTRLFVFGGSEPSSFYGSVPVSEQDAALSDAIGSTTGGALYFPEGRETSRLGAPITAITRFFDRLMLFTSEGAWVTDLSEDGALRVTQVNASVGCDRVGGAAMCGSFPVTVFGGKLWKWTAKTTARNECTAEVLSDGFAELAAEVLSGDVSVQYYGSTGELWIAPVGDADGRVLILRVDDGTAYTFREVYLDRLLPSSSDAVLLLGSEVMAFSDALYSDRGTDDGIFAYYGSDTFDLGRPGEVKHLSRYLFEGDPDGTVTLRFHGERGACFAVDLTGQPEEPRTSYGGRATVSRFERLAFSFTSAGKGRPTVESLTVTARK